MLQPRCNARGSGLGRKGAQQINITRSNSAALCCFISKKQTYPLKRRKTVEDLLEKHMPVLRRSPNSISIT